MNNKLISLNTLRIGLDVGSTTVKAVVIEEESGNVVFTRYLRHHAKLAETTVAILQEIAEHFERQKVRIAVCGSGGKPIAQAIGAVYIQEVVANAAAISKLYPQARCAIELGGQDAKVIFFEADEATGKLIATDMRMNGSCAGGTGAFIDEIAVLLDAEHHGLEHLASLGSKVYHVSGRCGVFAKSDIQPLRIQGARSEDLALSAFHAIAKQTIGGLAQGLELAPPIIFEGGPLTFNPTLVNVFAERLGLSESEIILPDHPETIVAHGAALAADEISNNTDGHEPYRSISEVISSLIKWNAMKRDTADDDALPFFKTPEEKAAFKQRHEAEKGQFVEIRETGVLKTYIGIDSGSTTSKIALLDTDGMVFDTYYAHNDGDPIEAVRKGLVALRDKHRSLGRELSAVGLGTTGYGEKMMAAAFGADVNTVETVSHARSCIELHPDATFILDIGGQDMKAIWLKDGTITNIMLNEACSSGCGSFLETFADSLGIKCEDIAENAFDSTSPAKLGSRCTVFMTSTVITEQRNGKQAKDIIAGLCRSIIENVFTKLIRLNNTDELGTCVVAQGGTFRNDAVLRALEEYLGRDVVRAPFPGEMGAIGAALICQDAMIKKPSQTSFIGFDQLERLEYDVIAGKRCSHCPNACGLTVTSFSTGAKYVSGNKCERGAIVSSGAQDTKIATGIAPNLHDLRTKMLFDNYPHYPVRPYENETIGLPRVLEFWDSMPFWSTFLQALGYKVVFSRPTDSDMFEKGLRFVASDTICMPAKVVHGHILDLCEQGVDHILFPYMMHTPPEGQDKMSPYMCAVVMGYPMVVRNFQDPDSSFDVNLHTPVFHWFSEEDRQKQICSWAAKELGASKEEARQAFSQGKEALDSFHEKLLSQGERILHSLHQIGGKAVVVAGRPYHSDPFLSHEVAKRFATNGIPVLAPDSLPGLSKVSLDNLLPEITNNFHTRMLESALIASTDPSLEYVQIVSFGCGHDAILTDEITRILVEAGGKHPLVLKLDESDASGSVNIRIQSFMETMNRKDCFRNVGGYANSPSISTSLSDPYKTAFSKEDKANRTVLIPNISGEISLLLRGAMQAEGFKAAVLPVGGLKQIRLGKRFTHNDICFPCQMVIGEVLNELRSGKWRKDEVAIGMVKFKCDCRMSHYAALLRRALDRAGFSEVPILTTDPVDTKGMHPGIAMLGPGAVIKAVWAAMMHDILQDIKRKIRPYELNPGETDRAFSTGIEDIAEHLRNGLFDAIGAYRRVIDAMAKIPYDRSALKPRVFVTGELLVTYHPGSNFHIEDYLVEHGMEAIFPRVTDQLRKDFIAAMAEISDYGADISKESYPVTALFDLAQSTMERIASAHPLFEAEPRPSQMYEDVSHIIPKTLSCGEGWLMAAEIAHYAKRGVRSFIILQPFGCLPNHICGRGITKKLKDEYQRIQILPLDLDPDTSQANIENRLQMLIMNEALQGKKHSAAHNAGGQGKPVYEHDSGLPQRSSNR